VAGVFGVYSFVAFRTFQGLLTVGDLVMYFLAVQRASGFLEGLGWSVSSLYESNLFLTTLGEFLGIQSHLPESAHPKLFPQPITQGITFDHVSFQYPHEERVAIRDFTFTIRPGEHVAFVGANGSGKTTLVKLLCRLYDPSGGRITVDGADLRDYPIADVRGAVSGIFQDFVKFQLSAKDNIVLGVRSHDVDLPAITQAAKQAGVHETIERLPKGYESLLGKLFDGGHELSIGEWQKMALARAVLRDSQILILDEPTSAMDAKAEAELFERFHELAQGRIAILISPSTVYCQNGRPDLCRRPGRDRRTRYARRLDATTRTIRHAFPHPSPALSVTAMPLRQSAACVCDRRPNCVLVRPKRGHLE
jgi:ATP-binding cassette, subfamily B, bacterial